MHRFVLAALLALLLFSDAPAQTRGGRAEYVGGTIEDFRAGEKGELYTSNRSQFYFATKKGSYGVPYDHINLVEYGQNVSRRYLEAILISPLLLAAKSRRHFLTVGFMDDRGEQQAVVFQVDKKAIRIMLVSLEARTGLKVTFQDEEARKAGKG